jgi:hypothetical protein
MISERLDDYLGEDTPVRAIDVFVDELDLAGVGFGGVEPDRKRRAQLSPAVPSCHQPRSGHSREAAHCSAGPISAQPPPRFQPPSA